MPVGSKLVPAYFPFVESHQLVVGYVIAKQTVVSSHPHIPVVIANAVDGVDVLLQYIFSEMKCEVLVSNLISPLPMVPIQILPESSRQKVNSPRYVESLGMIFSTARVCVSI